MRFDILFDMFHNLGFKMATYFINLARIKAGTGKFYTWNKPSDKNLFAILEVGNITEFSTL